MRRPPRTPRTATLFPDTPLFRSLAVRVAFDQLARFLERPSLGRLRRGAQRRMKMQVGHRAPIAGSGGERQIRPEPPIIVTQIFTLFADRKSTRLNSSH